MSVFERQYEYTAQTKEGIRGWQLTCEKVVDGHKSNCTVHLAYRARGVELFTAYTAHHFCRAPTVSAITSRVEGILEPQEGGLLSRDILRCDLGVVRRLQQQK
jgi:hypothetical protein